MIRRLATASVLALAASLVPMAADAAPVRRAQGAAPAAQCIAHARYLPSGALYGYAVTIHGRMLLRRWETPPTYGGRQCLLSIAAPTFPATDGRAVIL